MKNIFSPILFLVAIVIVCSCGSDQSGDKQTTQLPSDSPDKSFSEFSANVIEDLWKLYPGWASSQGYHKYDSVLVVPDSAFHQKEISFANEEMNALKKFDETKLNSSNKTDFYILENMLKGIIFNVNEFKEYEWNPASYNVSST